MNLVQMLNLNARKFPHNDCLRAAGHGWTYGQAAGLLQSWSVAKGERVAVMSHNTVSFGVVVVPVNHKLMAL